MRYLFFFFNDTATTEIYTLSLHDALPISQRAPGCGLPVVAEPAEELQGAAPGGADQERHHAGPGRRLRTDQGHQDRKSTRLNSSHSQISYAVFCLKKKKKKKTTVA